jgi:hypothetical protein
MALAAQLAAMDPNMLHPWTGRVQSALVALDLVHPADDYKQGTAMTDQSDRETRWRLVRDVVVFQIKLGMEAVLDITLIPASTRRSRRSMRSCAASRP